MTLKVYAYHFRSRAERVIWAIEEAGLDYELVRLNPFKGETQTEEFISLNPSKKIPVLIDGDKTLTESLAIMEHIHSIVPDRKLIPDQADELISYRKWMYFMVSEIENYLWIADQATRLNKIYSWPPGTDASAIQQIQKNIPNLYDAIGESAFLAGARFSLADIYAYHLLVWASAYEIALPDHVRDYLDRLESRPACPQSIKSNSAE